MEATDVNRDEPRLTHIYMEETATLIKLRASTNPVSNSPRVFVHTLQTMQQPKRFVHLQVLQPLEGVGVVVFPEFRLTLLPPGGAVAGGLGFHPVARQPGTCA